VQLTVIQRRRLALVVAVSGLLLLLFLVVKACSTNGEADSGNAATPRKATPKPKLLPRGGRRLFPDFRVVALYGNPRDAELGELGIGTPTRAGIKLNKQAKPYARKTRPVLPAMELISTMATAAPGPDGNYSDQQPAEMIDRYLKAARRAKALLILDIQPGRARFSKEIERLKPWLKEPDVGLALDPEWRVGPDQVPGQVIGSMHADNVNLAARYLSKVVSDNKLPEKLLLVHRFTDDMIIDDHRLRESPGVRTVINTDGFGTASAKVAKYHDFARRTPTMARGFKLFYKEDTNVMTPRQVMALRPRPDLVVYE
jgi:hypothetical protein